jgi:hypothetical protein
MLPTAFVCVVPRQQYWNTGERTDFVTKMCPGGVRHTKYINQKDWKKLHPNTEQHLCIWVKEAFANLQILRNPAPSSSRLLIVVDFWRPHANQKSTYFKIRNRFKVGQMSFEFSLLRAWRDVSSFKCSSLMIGMMRVRLWNCFAHSC